VVEMLEAGLNEVPEVNGMSHFLAYVWDVFLTVTDLTSFHGKVLTFRTYRNYSHMVR
jgi:hypothetical protein